MARRLSIGSLPLLVVVGLLASGCTMGSKPPESIGEYDWIVSEGFECYPQRTIALYNLQLAVDPDVPVERRVAALRLVEHIGADYPEVWEQLLMLADNPQTPTPLGIEVRQMLRPTGHAAEELAIWAP